MVMFRFLRHDGQEKVKTVIRRRNKLQKAYDADKEEFENATAQLRESKRALVDFNLRYGPAIQVIEGN